MMCKWLQEPQPCMHVHCTSSNNLFIRRNYNEKIQSIAMYIYGLETFLTRYFVRDDNISQWMFPEYMIYNMSWINSWVAEALRVKFLPKVTEKTWHRTFNLMITRTMLLLPHCSKLFATVDAKHGTTIRLEPILPIIPSRISQKFSQKFFLYSCI